MFEPYLKSFYIRSTDPTQIKVLKVSDTEVVRPFCPILHTRRPTQISTVATSPKPLAAQAPGCPSQKCLPRKPD